jgi:hypothetical protein
MGKAAGGPDDPSAPDGEAAAAGGCARTHPASSDEGKASGCTNTAWLGALPLEKSQ